ncbi:MAG: hypothetical protein A2Y87_12530 [Bacteroidetes bacterium RBG_13_46_8]|nr:MAG: hypothetical protein A2Y87_12530 [Bacteroidetes bacterium RBG_13_46_8]
MRAPIIIDFERAGGYAGLTLHTTVDSHSLSADEKEELGRLLNDAEIPELMKETTLPESSPDQFIYTLNIQMGEEQHFIQLSEKQISPSVRPLLKFLTIRSRFKKKDNESL